MSCPVPENRFHQLAVAVAAGTPVATWCAEHGVVVGTAYTWHRRDAFRRLVAEYRRRAEVRAIKRIAKGLGTAVEKVIELIEAGQDDHTKLSAAATLLDKLLLVQSHAELEDDLRRLDDRLAAQEGRREPAHRTLPGANGPT